MSLNLKIVSPEKVVYEGAVERVVVPGTSGEFEILVNHAPIISTLEKGMLVYQDSEGRHELMVNGGFDNKGFSFIEAMVQCPTAYGRKNKMGSPANMLKWMRDNAVMKAAWDKLPDDKKTGEKFPIGLFYQTTATDYDTAYDEVIERAGGAK